MGTGGGGPEPNWAEERRTTLANVSGIKRDAQGSGEKRRAHQGGSGSGGPKGTGQVHLVHQMEHLFQAHLFKEKDRFCSVEPHTSLGQPFLACSTSAPPGRRCWKQQEAPDPGSRPPTEGLGLALTFAL